MRLEVPSRKADDVCMCRSVSKDELVQRARDWNGSFVDNYNINSAMRGSSGGDRQEGDMY